jgi:AcrR family transcriptional regulator
LEGATATRTSILEAARRLFVTRGVSAVTIGEIAREARVAVPTVYASIGGKSEILAALLDPARTDPTVAETLAVVAASTDPLAIIRHTARGTRLTHERHWDVVHALVDLAQGDPLARPVVEDNLKRYVRALRTIAERLVVLGGLRSEYDVDAVTDALWFFFGQRAWLATVGDRGWSFDRAEAWLSAQAARALLLSPDTSTDKDGHKRAIPRKTTRARRSR